jgi:hypothetical protein
LDELFVDLHFIHFTPCQMKRMKSMKRNVRAKLGRLARPGMCHVAHWVTCDLEFSTEGAKC